MSAASVTSGHVQVSNDSHAGVPVNVDGQDLLEAGSPVNLLSEEALVALGGGHAPSSRSTTLSVPGSQPAESGEHHPHQLDGTNGGETEEFYGGYEHHHQHYEF